MSISSGFITLTLVMGAVFCAQVEDPKDGRLLDFGTKGQARHHFHARQMDG